MLPHVRRSWRCGYNMAKLVNLMNKAKPCRMFLINFVRRFRLYYDAPCRRRVCGSLPFARRKVSFHRLKGLLLHAERRHIAKWLIINRLHIGAKPPPQCACRRAVAACAWPYLHMPSSAWVTAFYAVASVLRMAV